MKSVLSIFCLLMAVGLAPAQAQPGFLGGLCADHATTEKLLANRYGERQVAVGLTTGGALFELYANRSGSNWSVLITKPNGLTCIVALGNDLSAEAIPMEELTSYPEM